MKAVSFIFLALFCLLLQSCTKNLEHKQWVKTEIYFGLSNKNGSIADSAWLGFKKNIDTTFSGYTAIDANGCWTDSTAKSVSERSVIIVYIHKPSAAENHKIQSLINLYKKDFEQQSVLRIEYEIKAYF